MSCGSNDDDLKLAKEYKYLLSCIRPLIDQLDKARDVQLCLLWLSKLEQCAGWERNYRNQILSELCKQVKANCLNPPFNVSPPNGPLRNIVCKDWKPIEFNIECSELDFSTEEVASSSSMVSLSSFQNRHKPLPVNWKKDPSSSNRSPNTDKEVVDHAECFAMKRAYYERAQSDQMVIERYKEIIKSLVSHQLKTDGSPSRLKKLQASYEVKLVELVQSLKKCQEENEVLKKQVECLGKGLDKSEEIVQENENLKRQVCELEIAKNSLDAKCKELEEDKLISVSDLITKLNESEKNLNDTERRLKRMEKNYEESCRNLESEFQFKITEKENKYMEELSRYKNELEEKEKEINNLKVQITNQSNQFEEEISHIKHQFMENSTYHRDKKKIKDLKSRAKKLEQMREHMTVLFQSQMQQILAKKDFYIASLEMQLKMNSCGGENCISEFHNTLNEKITGLEDQYRQLLEDSEQQFIKRRQLDLQKIHSLEKQLLSHGLMEDKDPELKSSFAAFGDTSDAGKTF